MITFPSIIEDLLSKGVINYFLICVFLSFGDVETFRRNIELVMRPETVIKGKILISFNSIMDRGS
jgi:hypothetical protein